jgi:hypothetical protein
MRWVFNRLLVILTLLQVLTACNGTTREGQVPSSSQITLLPYHTARATPILPLSFDSTASPSSTPEPVTYTVVAGDSLSSIAFRFGIDLNALIQSNPAVNANAMPIGTKLIIPPVANSTGTSPDSIAGLPTPIIAWTGKPNCYRADDGQWVCFMLVSNDLDVSVGNITGYVKMTGATFNFSAACPLNLIPAGVSAPLITRIQNVEINPDSVEGSLTSAIPVDEKVSRYAIVRVTKQEITVNTDQRSAKVSGEVTPNASGVIRVLAYALDTQGHVIGYRVWESATSVPAGTPQPVQLFLYSLGGDIAKIHLLAQVNYQ